MAVHVDDVCIIKSCLHEKTLIHCDVNDSDDEEERGHYRRWRQHSGLRILSNYVVMIYLTAASIFARLVSLQMLLWKKQQRWAGCYSSDVATSINARTRGSHGIGLEAQVRRINRRSRMSHHLQAQHRYSHFCPLSLIPWPSVTHSCVFSYHDVFL